MAAPLRKMRFLQNFVLNQYTKGYVNTYVKKHRCNFCNSIPAYTSHVYNVQGVNSFSYRTHHCSELKLADVGKHVKLCGWVQHQRMGLFVTLRDSHGVTQLVIPEDKVSLQQELSDLPLESVILVQGAVKPRPEGEQNKKIPTGDVEVVLSEFQLLNPCRPNLPFHIGDHSQANEAVRMQYRYLDLRRTQMQQRLRIRSEMVMKMREFLCNQHGFIDVETPTLFKRTPGGAKEFVVPTHYPGRFYCLPQSPQQFKQLLMVGGIDRYMQIARCYRDEGSRSDRQPEFTQVDLEMSFITQEGIMSLVEGAIAHSWPSIHSKIAKPFPRIRYENAMARYGTDKPDTRFEMTIVDVTEDFKECHASVIQAQLQIDGATAQVINIRHGAAYISKSEIEKLQTMGKEQFSVQAHSQHYDLVLNGQEIGGGSIRIHDACLQRYILEEVLQERSSELAHLLEALEMGCPPHGGIALGLDRLVAIACGTDTIRNVIAFPKTGDGKCAMSGAPAELEPRELERYHIKVKS
ncbi:PREDICTED: aspartate--tRNA ligase, mitochondrial-like [Priapulus caudatus]|uniref:Aspartate--tRNA ligase, mitochondrial-like n=1 Tax=Priapulus caudatus TaxID=37621 RepID=A0ABM1EUA3_PRICU|nr:PREDICTED: aspartate--tRNA ligase, mitochondrial-like [Priapulus caudatus]